MCMVLLFPGSVGLLVCDAIQDSSHLAVRCGVPCGLLCDCIMKYQKLAFQFHTTWSVNWQIFIEVIISQTYVICIPQWVARPSITVRINGRSVDLNRPTVPKPTFWSQKHKASQSTATVWSKVSATFSLSVFQKKQIPTSSSHNNTLSLLRACWWRKVGSVAC